MIGAQSALFRANVATAAFRLVAPTAPATAEAVTAAISAATATTESTTSAATTTTESAATAPTAPRTLFGGIHAEGTPSKLMTIELLDCRGSVAVRLELDECEAAWTASIAVHRKEHILDLAGLGEEGFDLLTSGVEIEIPYKDFGSHEASPLRVPRRST